MADGGGRGGAVRGAHTRGVRNHNPGNIEFDPGTKWQGLAEPATDGRFARFRASEWGIRALARVLIFYQDRHGIRTIEGIIRRWAPPSENNTTAYVSVVCRQTGFAPRDELDMHRHEHLRPLVEAIIAHECAGYRYPAAVIDEALRLAGVPAPAEAAATRSGTAKAAAGTAAAGISAAAVVEVVEAAGPHLPVAASLAEAVGPWVVALLVALAAGWFVWQRVRRAREMGA